MASGLKRQIRLTTRNAARSHWLRGVAPYNRVDSILTGAPHVRTGFDCRCRRRPECFSCPGFFFRRLQSRSGSNETRTNWQVFVMKPERVRMRAMRRTKTASKLFSKRLTQKARRRMSSFIMRADEREGRFAELDPDQVRAAMDVTALGAFFVAHEAAKRMVPREAGTLLFTGASAGIKGFPQSAPFAMGKFALRGLCQSLARELHPKNIHVVHFVIDGAIHRADRGVPYSDPEKTTSSGRNRSCLPCNDPTAPKHLDKRNRIAPACRAVLISST